MRYKSKFEKKKIKRFKTRVTGQQPITEYLLEYLPGAATEGVETLNLFDEEVELLVPAVIKIGS